MFVALINELQFAFDRQGMLFHEFKMDLSVYDEIFFSIIDKLLVLKFGRETAELINFYIYERQQVDGTFNHLIDEGGNKVVLNSAEELWNLLVKINPSLEK